MRCKDVSENHPSQVLLATDLSPRSDRALDRAAQLAQQWNAQLTALNVLDPAWSPDQALAWVARASEDHLMLEVQRQLARDLQSVGLPVNFRLARQGDVCASIGRIAGEIGADLVVAGVSRDETLGQFFLGSTAENLSRTLAMPLLVVRGRTHGPYKRIVVSTDFSDSSRLALIKAERLFPAHELTVFHACKLLMADATAASPTVRSHLCQSVLEGEFADFLAATYLHPETKVRPVVEYGEVEAVLSQYVRAQEVDLAIVGSHGRSAIWSMLIGSTTAKLLQWLPCDIMVVSDPHARNT